MLFVQACKLACSRTLSALPVKVVEAECEGQNVLWGPGELWGAGDQRISAESLKKAAERSLGSSLSDAAGLVAWGSELFVPPALDMLRCRPRHGVLPMSPAARTPERQGRSASMRSRRRSEMRRTQLTTASVVTLVLLVTVVLRRPCCATPRRATPARTSQTMVRMSPGTRRRSQRRRRQPRAA